MQRHLIEARVNLARGYSASDMLLRRIELLREDSTSELMLCTGRISVPASPDGVNLNFDNFTGQVPSYLVLQNNHTTGYVTVTWNGVSANIATRIPSGGGIAIFCNPVENGLTPSGILLSSSSGDAPVEYAMWGD